MRRNVFFGTSLLFCFLAFYWLGRTLPQAVNEKSLAPILAPSGNTASRPPKLNISEETKGKIKSWKDFFQIIPAGELYQAMYDHGFKDFFKNEELRQAIHERFSRGYPIETDKHHFTVTTNEMIVRLGILKVLKDAFTPDTYHQDPAQLIALYEEVLLNQSEHSTVKRQALENLSQWGPFVDQNRRDRIIASLEPSTVILATKTEREILTEAIEANAN